MNRPEHLEAGFTLVEMLVALVIFAILAGAGVGLLRSSVDVQDAVAVRLGGMAQVARLDSLLASDIGQAVNRPSRAPDGVRPAFAGTSDTVTLVAAGWSDPDGAGRSDLRRIRWSSDREGLSRTTFGSVDGSDAEAVAAVMMRGASSVRFRYRLADGSWTSSFTSTETEPLPAAIELHAEGPELAGIDMVYRFPEGAVDRRPPVPAEQAQ